MKIKNRTKVFTPNCFSIIFILSVCFIFISCRTSLNNSNNKRTFNNVDSLKKATILQNSEPKNINDNELDFKKKLTETLFPEEYYYLLKNEVNFGHGAIQNNNYSGFYLMGSFNGNESKKSFEVILVPIDTSYFNSDFKTLMSLKNESNDQLFAKFNIVLVEVPKLPISKIKDEFDMGLITPCKAKTFLRIDNLWYKYTDIELKSFSDLTILEGEIVTYLKSVSN